MLRTGRLTKGTHMDSRLNKIKNKAEDLTGKGKEATGKATD